jgi:hypothetical protein
MPLPDDVRSLADLILGRLDEARNFYLHTRQAWRVVQQIAHEGLAVGIVDAASGREVPIPRLEPLARRYVTVYLAESAFRGLSGLQRSSSPPDIEALDADLRRELSSARAYERCGRDAGGVARPPGVDRLS